MFAVLFEIVVRVVVTLIRSVQNVVRVLVTCFVLCRMFAEPFETEIGCSGTGNVASFLLFLQNVRSAV